MKKLDEITLADLMPDSISGDANVGATARAIDPQLKAVSEAVDKPLILAAIDTLPSDILEHLAVQYDVTSWDSAWPIGTKRAVMKAAIADKRKMGTRGAVQRAIEAVAPLATITEWWQTDPKGTPHTFTIDVLQDGSAVDAETQRNVISQVNEAKPARSHYTFGVQQNAQGNLYLAGVLRSIAYARVRSAGTTIEQTAIDAGVLAAMRGVSIRRIIEYSHMGDMPEPTPVSVELYAYFTTNKSPINLSSSGNRNIYDETGARIQLEPEKEYLPTKYILSDETEIIIPSSMARMTYFNLVSNSSTNLSVYHYAYYVLNNVVSVQYEKSPAALITAWVSADKTPQTVGPWSLRYLYNNDGNQIVKPEGLATVAYYYVDGVRVYNNDLKVRMTSSGNMLQIGAASNISIEKVEFSIQPVPTW